jgi:tetratricopeptide (TPR) repeat protein
MYLEVERVEDAIHQYRIIQDIDPAFDPPYDALAELKHKFPHLFREREEPREPERREEWRPRIEGEMRELEESVERRPDDIELRMKLARAYREAGKVEAAIMQYKAALEIKPGFDPPYKALKELGYRFPDEPRDRERPLEDSIGEVISTNEKEVKLKTREGETVVFRVPHRQKDDGSWVLNDDLSEMAKSLERSDQVKIVWQEVEGRKVIRRMERVKE